MIQINFKTIKEALSQPTSEYFWISYNHGIFETGDKESFYNNNQNYDDLVFDHSNNKVLANVSINGSLKYLTFYRSSYRADMIPGVWVRKDFSRTGPYSFSVRMDGEEYDLSKVDWPFRTSLLDNIFPITQLTGEKIKVTLITYAPVSEDGKERLRGIIYGAFLENTSDGRIKGSVVIPKISVKTDGPYLELNPDVYIEVTGQNVKNKEIPFDLSPGENSWVPVVIQAPGESAASDIAKAGSLYWLNSTWTYFRKMTGKLNLPDDKFIEEFFQRSVYQCIESIGMDGNGRVAGSNWGTYPTTENIWMKDMYYSYLPLFMFEPEFFKEGILWFLEYSIRPMGNLFNGGVSHSLNNSLTPVVMAGLYYTSTGDKEFFLTNKHVKEAIVNILNQLINSRENKDIWLFPSVWISDGCSIGDYHTGSNLLAWHAFKYFARVLEEVYGEHDAARDFTSIAGEIKAAIEKNNIIDGPFGRQYIEGVNNTEKMNRTLADTENHKQIYGRNGLQYLDFLNSSERVPCMVQDGEESDTTLMPIYGFLEYDDPCYKNYTRFAVSESNLFYIPETKGILWEDYTDATFPGYITGFTNVIDKETMNGEKGYMTEIRRLTDVDGSIWWWPYDKGSKYGEVLRNNFCGKCAWASGVFVGLFVAEILGIKYDAPSKTLSFRPFSPSSGFSWEDFRFGRSIFSINYLRNQDAITVSVTNKNDYSIRLDLEIVVAKGAEIGDIYLNDKQNQQLFEKGHFLDRGTVKISENLLPGELKKITVAQIK
jgi:hypothetical protein